MKKHKKIQKVTFFEANESLPMLINLNRLTKRNKST